MFILVTFLGGLTTGNPNCFVKSVNSLLSSPEVDDDADGVDDDDKDEEIVDDEDDDSYLALDTSQRMTRALKKCWRCANSAKRVAV